MRARAVGRAAGVDDGKRATAIERHEWRQTGMEGEETVEIEGCVCAVAGPRNRNRGPATIVLALTAGDDHIQAVDRAALEDCDEQLRAGRGGRSRSRQKRWREPEAHQCKPAVPEKDASGDHYYFL